MFGWFGKKEVETKVEVKNISEDFSGFDAITNFLYKKSGIIDLEKRALSSSRLKQYAREHSIYTTTEFLQLLQQQTEAYQEAINIVTVNETYFFREIKELNWLINYIKESDKKLKILSMPCSSGEEIYSIILLMLKNNIPLDKVELVGYDINSQMIQKAKKATYHEHSLHNVDDLTRENYFSITQDKQYTLQSHILTNATFKQQNIFEIDTTQEKYDVILSRNMFIYFDEAKKAKAVEIITKMLDHDGIFIKGHADNIAPNKNLNNIAYGVYKFYTPCFKL